VSGAAGRRWLLRGLLAVGVPVVCFAALEGALRLGGYGRSPRFLIPDARPGFYRTNPDFVSSFLPSTFDLRPLNARVAMPKPAGALRVVLLGESAAQGVPVPAFGFAAQLRAQLRARFPGREIEVINTGIVAINSHVIYQIAKQLAAFAPDVFVVYAGNNEVVGPYGPGSPYLSAMPPLWVIRLSVWVRQSRTGQLVNAAVARLARGRRKPIEWGGMSMFVHSTVAGDDPRLEAVYANFEANLRDIVRVAAAGGARTLLCTVGCNLRDCAPFVSRHRAGLAGDELRAWTRAFERGRLEWLLGQADGAARDLAEARRLDPQYAETSYLLGDLAAERGPPGAGRALLVDAEHWDALRFRPDPRINAAVRRVAGASAGQAELLDTAQLLGSDPAATVPPSGRHDFMEHVHLDWAGNFLVARAMAERVAALADPATPAGPARLDDAACAAAVGYTPPERLGVLQHVATITQNPPFTAQVTYIEDEARLKADLAAAGRVADDPEALRRAADVLAQARARDPENPDLAKLAEDVADRRGDLAAALALARRAQELQPYDFALATPAARRATGC
jgi:tetratricopeptide (TPR) repeat protein